MKYTLSVLLVFTCLSGCTENGVLIRSYSDYSGDRENSGIYYIGEPYRLKGKRYTPAEDLAYTEKGMATWYSRDDLNRLTTNGEVFDDNKLTAAHKTLPLPSMVRITNLENGNTAIVRVNDRGPLVRNRLIDVSRKTAELLELPETGTTMVQVDILPEESLQLKAELMGDSSVKQQDKKESDETIALGEPIPVYQPGADMIPVYDGKIKTESIQPITETKVSDSQEVLSEGIWHIQVGAFGQRQNVINLTQKLEKIGPVITDESGNLTRVSVGPFKTKIQAQEMLDKLVKEGYVDAHIKLKK